MFNKNQSEQLGEEIAIALGFWNVLSEEPKYSLSLFEIAVLDHMYGRTDSATIRACSYNPENIYKYAKNHGYYVIYGAAGGDDMAKAMLSTIEKLNNSLPGAKIGLAVNDVVHLDVMLEMTGIYDQFDFVVNSAKVNCQFPESDYISILEEEAGPGRILMVNDYFPTQSVPGIEMLPYDNRLTKTGLYETVMEYLNFI